MSNKQLWVLAGGNGAGKSTFYKLYLQAKDILFINADLIAKKLDKDQTESVSYDAAKIAERLRSDLLRSGTSFCFETVFSHPSKIQFIVDAKALGYEVILVYIHLQDSQLNLARVAQRVTEGGHSVPTDKIITRIPRALMNVSKALPLADEFLAFDNSSRRKPYHLIFHIKNRVLNSDVHPLPDWANVLLNDTYVLE